MKLNPDFLLKAIKMKCPNSEERLRHQGLVENLHKSLARVFSEDVARKAAEQSYEASAYVTMLANRNEEDCPGLRQYIELNILAEIIEGGIGAINEQLHERDRDREQNN